MTTYPNIALVGHIGAGKTTIAGLLCAHYGYDRMTWADPVKQLARMAYGHIDKGQLYEVSPRLGEHTTLTGREILQRLGTDAIRDNVDKDFWVKVGLRAMDTAEENAKHPLLWVNDDTRMTNEAHALRDRGFKIVKLRIPAAEACRRTGMTIGHYGAVLSHESETQIEAIDPDIEVWNTGDPMATTSTILETLALERAA